MANKEKYDSLDVRYLMLAVTANKEAKRYLAARYFVFHKGDTVRTHLMAILEGYYPWDIVEDAQGIETSRLDIPYNIDEEVKMGYSFIPLKSGEQLTVLAPQMYLLPPYRNQIELSDDAYSYNHQLYYLGKYKNKIVILNKESGNVTIKLYDEYPKDNPLLKNIFGNNKANALKVNAFWKEPDIENGSYTFHDSDVVEYINTINDTALEIKVEGFSEANKKAEVLSNRQKRVKPTADDNNPLKIISAVPIPGGDGDRIENAIVDFTKIHDKKSIIIPDNFKELWSNSIGQPSLKVIGSDNVFKMNKLNLNKISRMADNSISLEGKIVKLQINSPKMFLKMAPNFLTFATPDSYLNLLLIGYSTDEEGRQILQNLYKAYKKNSYLYRRIHGIYIESQLKEEDTFIFEELKNHATQNVVDRIHEYMGAKEYLTGLDPNSEAYRLLNAKLEECRKKLIRIYNQEIEICEWFSYPSEELTKDLNLNEEIKQLEK